MGRFKDNLLFSLFKNNLSTHSFPMLPFSTCFQGVEKGCIGKEWVNYISFAHLSGCQITQDVIVMVHFH